MSSGALYAPSARSSTALVQTVILRPGKYIGKLWNYFLCRFECLCWCKGALRPGEGIAAPEQK